MKKKFNMKLLIVIAVIILQVTLAQQISTDIVQPANYKLYAHFELIVTKIHEILILKILKVEGLDEEILLEYSKYMEDDNSTEYKELKKACEDIVLYEMFKFDMEYDDTEEAADTDYDYKDYEYMEYDYTEYEFTECDSTEYDDDKEKDDDETKMEDNTKMDDNTKMHDDNTKEDHTEGANDFGQLNLAVYDYTDYDYPEYDYTDYDYDAILDLEKHIPDFIKYIMKSLTEQENLIYPDLSMYAEKIVGALEAYEDLDDILYFMVNVQQNVTVMWRFDAELLFEPQFKYKT